MNEIMKERLFGAVCGVAFTLGVEMTVLGIKSMIDATRGIKKTKELRERLEKMADELEAKK